MFEEFFDLRENPFALAPNPRFIFQSHEHIEALAHFRYWIENGEGFVLITGEVGTGKTTALFDLMAQLPTEWAVGFVANSTLVPSELLEEVCRRFRIDIPPGATKPTLLARLESFLNERGDHGLRSLLILDEAQNFEPRLLEEVRLLSNLERATGKLLQIALVGQPELDRKLELPELRQLRQRIGIRYRLGPLGEEECLRYIHHRVTIAGGDAERIFPPATASAIYKLTHGIPREINIVASQSLITAFVQGAEQVQPEHVQSVVEEFSWSSIFGREVPPPQRRPRMSEPPRIGEPQHRIGEPPHRGGEPLPRVGEPAPRAEPQPRFTEPPPRVVPPRIDPIRTRPSLEVLRGGGGGGERGRPEPGPYAEGGAPPRGEPLRDAPVGPGASGHGEKPPRSHTAAPGHPGAGASHIGSPAGSHSPVHTAPGQSQTGAGAAGGGHAFSYAGTQPAAHGTGVHTGVAPPATGGGAPSSPQPPVPAAMPSPVAVHPPRRPTLLPEAEPRERSPWILIAALILLLGAIVGSGFWLRAVREKPESSRPGAVEQGKGGSENAAPDAGTENPKSDPAETEGEGEAGGESAKPTSDAGAAREVPAGERATARSSPRATPVATAPANPAPTRSAPPAEPRSQPASQARTTPGAGTDADGDFVIHAASFIGDAAKISEVRREYESKLGVPVAVVRVGMTGEPWWNRVYLGPYTTRAAAREAQAELARRGLLDPDAAVIQLSANATP